MKQLRRQATVKKGETGSILNIQGLLSRAYKELVNINNEMINSIVAQYKDDYNKHFSQNVS